MSEQLVARLRELHAARLRESGSRGDNWWVTVERSHLLEVARTLREDPALDMNMPTDLTVVDYMDRRADRFEVVIHLRSLRHGHRLRISVPVPEDDCTCPSLTSIWKGFNWPEREAWDFYGVHFVGHPDEEKFGKLRRLLLYEGFEGHPLRKDYPKDRRQPILGPDDSRGVFGCVRGPGLDRLDEVEAFEKERSGR